MVVSSPKESIREHVPEIFHKSGYGKCRVIKDCAEVLIRPKSLSAQAATWPDYKHHNTFGMTPTGGFILFLSSCYGGRASDKFMTRDTGFYDLFERDDEEMADRGFQIQEDLLLHFCRLVIPPGARVKSQMTKSEVKKTKEVAKFPIYIGKAINRIKFFRILNGTIPVIMIQHVDDTILTLAALGNLKPRLIKT